VLHTVYVAAYSTTVHVVIHLMLLPYKLCHTVTQLMLLGHNHTIYVVRNITYDAMSLIATYVAARHNLLIATRRSPIGVTRFAL
jgi:hypothetical protein